MTTALQIVLFYVFGAVSVISAILVITRKNAVHSALFLILTLFSVAGIFLINGAEFIAAVQVLVYAGGIMVLFLFVILLVRLEGIEKQRNYQTQWWIAVPLAIIFIFMIGMMVQADKDYAIKTDRQEVSVETTTGQEVAGNVQEVGWILFRDYLLPFEIASVLLLMAMIAAIVLARKEID